MNKNKMKFKINKFKLKILKIKNFKLKITIMKSNKNNKLIINKNIIQLIIKKY